MQLKAKTLDLAYSLIKVFLVLLKLKISAISCIVETRNQVISSFDNTLTQIK